MKISWCPWCGGRCEIAETYLSRPKFGMTLDRVWYQVACNECRAKGPACLNPSNAVLEWGRVANALSAPIVDDYGYPITTEEDSYE